LFNELTSVMKIQRLLKRVYKETQIRLAPLTGAVVI